MPGNNPNQNARLNENHAKGPVKGFPGMKNEATGPVNRSSLDVAAARVANAENSVDDDHDLSGDESAEPPHRAHKIPRSRER
jgi:hypothetical protein